MSEPIVIIPEEKETITLRVDDFRKYINDAYRSGVKDGFEQGKAEKITYYSPTKRQDGFSIDCTALDIKPMDITLCERKG